MSPDNRENPYIAPSADATLTSSNVQINSSTWRHVYVAVAILRLIAMVLAIASVASAIQLYFLVRQAGFYMELSSVNLYFLIRVAFALSWAFVAWSMWRYSTSLLSFCKRGLPLLARMIKMQMYVWISIALMILLFVVTVAVSSFSP